MRSPLGNGVLSEDGPFVSEICNYTGDSLCGSYYDPLSSRHSRKPGGGGAAPTLLLQEDSAWISQGRSMRSGSASTAFVFAPKYVASMNEGEDPSLMPSLSEQFEEKTSRREGKKNEAPKMPAFMDQFVGKSSKQGRLEELDGDSQSSNGDVASSENAREPEELSSEC